MISARPIQKAEADAHLRDLLGVNVSGKSVRMRKLQARFEGDGIVEGAQPVKHISVEPRWRHQEALVKPAEAAQKQKAVRISDAVVSSPRREGLVWAEPTLDQTAVRERKWADFLDYPNNPRYEASKRAAVARWRQRIKEGERSQTLRLERLDPDEFAREWKRVSSIKATFKYPSFDFVSRCLNPVPKSPDKGFHSMEGSIDE